MSNVQTAVYPSKFAKAFGLEVKTGPKGNALSHNTGEPVKPVDKQWAAQWLKANASSLSKIIKENGKDREVYLLRCSGANKVGGEGYPLKRFLIDAVKLSHSQGYLTLKDLAKLANLSTVNYGVGNKDFAGLVNKIVLAGCLVEGERGRTSGEQETTFSVSDVEIDDSDLAIFG